MRVEIMAFGLPLRPVAHVVQTHHADRTGHADERSQIDQYPFEPQRGDEAAMDQQPVQTDAMAKA
ncbi:hypothetical protein MOP88_10850 [Sphingomonas sp. WKB10]|nr:hypothetical protein [Sphingomonas sp. WKB10]